MLSELSLLFIDGIGFDPFFRGLLSVLVAVVVLVGGTYLLVATNTGARQGFLLSLAGLFGWMFIMGIVWTTYGLGWVGDAPQWELAEINVDDAADGDDGLLFSEIEPAQQLAGQTIVIEGIDDPDLAQTEALEAVERGDVDLGGWEYLPTSDALRGEAQAAADGFIQENDVFESGDYIPLQFGGFGFGGKEKRPADGNLAEQAWHKVKTSAQLKHPDKYMAIQVRSTIEQPTLPGEAPPVATADEEAKLVTVIMKLDRGGPIPSYLSGLRFVPTVFTIANAALFAACALALHNRDRREAEIRAAAA